VSRARSTDGFTVVELMLAATMMLMVLGATLTVFETMLKVNHETTRQSEAQDAARLTINAIARDLRNVAEPNPAVGNPAAPPPAIEEATATSLMLRQVDPAGGATTQNAYRVRRIRYCLDGDTAGNGMLYKQTQTWTTPNTPAVPSTSACPGTGWATTHIEAQSLTNRLDARTDRPLFSYNPTTFTDPNAILGVIPTFWVDVDPQRTKREARLSTGFFLRNQNRPPVSNAAGAAFTATVTGSGGVTLNALSYEDPEGGVLSYVWYDGTEKIGTGAYLNWVVPPAGRNQYHTFSLKVFDVKGAETDAPGQTVFVT
jgi:type II secretory pathway component PulJ